MDMHEMAHRWCNCDFGRNGGFKGSNIHCDETHYCSYSTVYAMWLDKTPGNKLMVMLDKAGSRSSSKHLSALKGAVPNDVKCIETNLPSTYWEWKNVNFSYKNWQVKLPISLLGIIDDLIEPFKYSKSIKTRDNLGVIKRKADDIRWLLKNRKECTVKEIDKALAKEAILKKIFSFIRKNNSVEELIDHILGKGTYASYDERLAPQKKAERVRKFVEWFGITHHCRGKFTKKEIDKMPISEKVMRACLPPREEWEIENNSWSVCDERDKRLARYLLGNDRIKSSFYGHGMDIVTNRFNGEKYKFIDMYEHGLYYQATQEVRLFVNHIMCSDGYISPCIVLSHYKKLQNKDQWLKRFYQKCAIISKRRSDVMLWLQMQFYTDKQMNQCSDGVLAIYNRVQLKYAAFLADQEAKRLAREEEQRRLEVEKARLEEERKLKYNDYVQRGIEGYRALYYEKLDSISVARSFGSEFFFGGNVLLRWRTDKLIETSKNIIVTIEQAKRIFGKVQLWHNNQRPFSECSLETNSGNYNANSYENDILTAGCHQIAYCEMERMYNEIISRESSLCITTV